MGLNNPLAVSIIYLIRTLKPLNFFYHNNSFKVFKNAIFMKRPLSMDDYRGPGDTRPTSPEFKRVVYGLCAASIIFSLLVGFCGKKGEGNLENLSQTEYIVNNERNQEGVGYSPR
jgi:hypothetical protein